MSSSKIDTSSEKMSLSLQLEERSRRWTWAANAALGPIEVHMVVVAQDLGRFDIELLELDNRIGIEGLLTAFQENTRRFALSRLWALGAYELIRTVEQRLRPMRGSNIHDRAIAVKKQFERARIPLAKFEAPRGRPNDWPIAFPAYNPTTGAVAWQVNENEFIERLSLSDGLLNFLEELGRTARSTGLSLH